MNVAYVGFRLRHTARRRWRAMVAIGGLTAITGTTVFLLAAGATRTLSAPDRYDDERGDPPDALVEQADGAPRTDDLAALDSVATVDSMTFVFGSLLPSDGDEPLDTLVFAGSVGASGTRVAEGREPDRDEPGEFAATASLLRETGLRLGDRVRLGTIRADRAAELGFYADLDGPTREATLVGVLRGPNQLQDDYRIALFPPSLLDDPAIGISATQHAVRLVDRARLGELRADLDDLPDGSRLGIDPDAEWVPEPVRDAVSARGIGIALMALTVGAAAIVVIGQLAGRQLRDSSDVDRVHRAMGTGRADRAAATLAQVAAPVACGSVVAGVAAYLFSGAFPLGFVEEVEATPGRLLDPRVHLAGPVALTLAVIGWVGASLVATRSRPVTEAPSWPVRTASRLGRAPATVGARFALGRNGNDDAGGTAQIAGSVLVAAIVVGALVVGSSIGRLIDEPARAGSFPLAFGAGGDSISDEQVDALEADPGVDAIALAATTFVAVGAEKLNVTGVQPIRGDLGPTVTDGRAVSADDEVVLGRVVAERLGLAAGDALLVEATDGPTTLRVTGIAILPAVDGGDGMGEGGLMTMDGLRALDPAVMPSTIALRVAPDAQDATLERVATILGTPVGPPDPPPAIVNLDRVREVPLLVAAVLVVLALLSVGHHSVVSVRRRRHDLAVLRALGGGRRWVGAVVRWQATTAASTVALVSLPIGVISGRLLFRSVAGGVGADDDPSQPLWWIAAAVASLVVGANLAAWPASRQARRATPGAALSRE